MDKLLLDELSQPVLDLFNGFENDLLINISKKFALNKGLLDTDPLAWQIQMMNNLGLLTRENLVLMAKQSGLTAGGINGILLNAGLDGVEVNEEILAQATKKGARLQIPPPVSESPKVLEILKAYEKQAKDVLNLTNQTMLKQADKIYVDIINRTAFDVISGTMTGDQALRKTIKQWGETGVPALIDSAGRRWGPEGYVRTVIRTTVGNVTNDMQDVRFDEYGVEYVEISSHAGARPKCEPYQGRVFSINAKAKKYPNISTTSQGQVDGLFGINCGHMKYAFVPGVSTQTYQPYDTEENNKIYKESQHQRAIERSIRKAKTQKGMLEASGDLKGAKGMDKLIASRQNNMRNFVKATGRTRRSGREQVVSLKGIKPLPVKPIKKGHIKTIKPVELPKPKPIAKPIAPELPKPTLADLVKAKKAIKPKPEAKVKPKPVKKDPPKAIDPNFTKAEIMDANKVALKEIDEMLASRFTTPIEAKELKAMQKEYKAGKWDHTKTFVGMDGNGDYKVFVDIPTPKKPKPISKPAPKAKPVARPTPTKKFANAEIAEANRVNIAVLNKKLNDPWVKNSNVPILRDLIKQYEDGMWDNTKTTIGLDGLGRPKVMILEKVADNLSNKVNTSVSSISRAKKDRPIINNKAGFDSIKKGDIYKSFDDDAFDEITELIQSMPDVVQAKFYKYGHLVKIDLQKPSAHYNSFSGRIHLTGDGTGNDLLRGKFGTLLHEIGHLIDEESHRPSRSKNFTDAIGKDYQDLIDSTMESLSPQSRTQERAFAVISQVMRASKGSSLGPQDVINGLSGGKIRADFVHGQEYWLRKDLAKEAGNELFAHMIAASASETQTRIMKKYFPTAWKEFLRMIK